jgi:hypothetical protein
VEGLLLIMVFATAMLVTPIAGAIGTAVYETRARVYAEESTRHTVTATVVEDSSASLRGVTQTSARPFGARPMVLSESAHSTWITRPKSMAHPTSELTLAAIWSRRRNRRGGPEPMPCSRGRPRGSAR